MALLSYSTIGICMLFIALLINSNAKSLANSILIAWLLVTIVELEMTYRIYSGELHPFAYYKAIVPTLHVGLLFTWMRVVFHSKKRFGTLLHLTPFVLLLIIGFFVDHKTLIIDYKIGWVILGIVALYLGLSIRLATKERSSRILFLRKILWCYLLIWIALLLANTIFVSNTMTLLWISMMSFVFLIWCFVMNSIRLALLQEVVQKMKYVKSGMTISKSKGLKAKLEKLLDEEQPFLNPNLKISDLSKLLGCTDNHLSQVVNVEFKVSFNDFVNLYRVNHFKALLKSGKRKHLTLFGIAEECGFQSKSTFNAAFKKATGLTPSEFKNRMTSDPTRSVA